MLGLLLSPERSLDGREVSRLCIPSWANNGFWGDCKHGPCCMVLNEIGKQPC